MKTIMLVCSAGMSTSLLVSKMKNAATEQGIEAEIFAISVSEIDNYLESKKIDVVLLGPQISYMKDKLSTKLEPHGIPLDSIAMQDYGMMRGDKVLEFANNLIDS